MAPGSAHRPHSAPLPSCVGVVDAAVHALGIEVLVATTALSINLTAAEMRIIPGATIVFVAARLAFWVGYRIHPLYRAFGMAATVYLNIGLLALALWKASLGS